MDFLLATTGSAGDVFPFLALGRALVARGADVMLVAPAEFGPAALTLGLRFVAVDLHEHRPRHTPLSMWRPRTAAARAAWEALRPFTAHWRKLARSSTIVPLLRPVYEVIAHHHRPGRTVVVASGPLLGARIAHDRLGVPLVTVHLSPASLRSVYDPPLQRPLCLPDWLPLAVRRASYRMADALVFDPLLAVPVNRFRKELGLGPVRRVFHEWRHSPQLVLALFPSWFAPPQPDWPAALRQPGFLYYDGAGAVASPEPKDLCTSGEPLAVFTPGSAIRNARRFFQEADRTCRTLGCRGLLLTRYAEHLPARLSAGVRHLDFVPLSTILPRASVLVHTGGIGTAAQGLAAGVPQVVMPLKNDQPETARRLEDLGVAAVLPPRQYRAETLGRALTQAFARRRNNSACAAVARRIDPRGSLAEACGLIERVYQEARSAVRSSPGHRRAS